MRPGVPVSRRPAGSVSGVNLPTVPGARTRRALVAAGAVLVLVGGPAGPLSAQGPAPVPEPAQAPEPTPAPATEVPSGGLAPATAPPALGERVRESDEASRRLDLVVVGLVGLAALILGATVVFWWVTRPSRDAPMPMPSMRWLEPDPDLDPRPSTPPSMSGSRTSGSPAAGEPPAAAPT